MILELVYPPECLHCACSLPEHRLLCQTCQDLFTLLPEEGRCFKCFAEIEMVSGICKSCREIAHPFAKLCGCFEGYGPAGSLAKGFSEHRQFRFAQDIAAFLIIQMERLHYPSFDLITTLPGYFFNRNQQIGKEVARMLGRPYKRLLKRNLTPQPAFSLRKKCNIINQTVLLLDIGMKTRSTIRSAGWALERGGAETIYGMTFCVI